MGRLLTVPGRSVLPSSAGPALNNTRAPIEAFGAPSRGLMQAGQQLGNLSDQLASEALRMQADENERVTKNLDVMYGEAIRKIQFGDGQSSPGYFSQMGENAIGGFEAASEALDKELESVASSVENPRAIELFKRVAQTRKLSALTAMSRHREQQQKVAAIATSDARITGAIQDAAANWRDSKAIGLSRATIFSEITDQAEKQGWSPDTTKQKLSEGLSAMHEQAIMNAFRVDPVEAQIYYQSNIGDINGTTQTKIEKTLEDGVLRTRSQELAGDYFSQYDTEAEAVAAAQNDLQGKLEDEAVSRISQMFSLKDRERGREVSQINAEIARQNRDRKQAKTEAEAAAPELAKELLGVFNGNEADAMDAARDVYDGEEYAAIESQISFQAGVARRVANDESKDLKGKAARFSSMIMGKDIPESEAIKEVEELFEGPMYKAVLSDLRARYAAKERDKKVAVNEYRSDALRAIYEGSSVAQWQQANPEAFTALSGEPGAISDLEKTYSQVVQGRLYSPASDGQTFESLRTLPQRDLATVDLLQYRSRMTEDEYKDVVRLQTSAAKAAESDANSRSAYSARDRAMNTYAPKVKRGGRWEKVLTPELEQGVANQTTQFIEDYHEQWSKWPTSPEIEREVQRLMLPLVADPDGLFNSVTVGDKIFGVNSDELTDEQVAVARVPFDKVPDDMVRQVRQVAQSNGIEFSEELVERFAALRALDKRKEAEELLGVRR